MIDLSLPVWSLPIDWTDGVTETLEFLTTVGESPSAIEQRRGLRLTPRQYFEYQYILKGPERTYFDLLTMRAGGSPCYLPIWHDVEVLAVEHAAGMTALGISSTYTEFMNCDAVMLGGTHDYELVEILGRADTVVTLTTALINTWPAGTRVVPLKKVKLDQQPSTTRKTELIHVARVKFCSIEPNRTDAEPPLNTFGLQYVLETDPNEVDDLTYNYERVLSTLDNTMGLPTLSDVTGRVLQQFAWWCRGRQEHHQLRGLFYSLDGRRVPVWVPTIYADFEPVTPIGAGDLAINVKRCGFTNLGGPGPQREYILIHLHNGTRYYRKITNSIILGDGTSERIFIDEAVGEDISLAQLNRISFLVLCRLDQDAVEIIHHTATRGMTTVVAVFRSAAAKDGIENVIEIPPGIISEPVCLSQFDWYVHTLSISANTFSHTAPRQLDQHGNYYEFATNSYNIYNPNGVLISTKSNADVFDDIDAHFGYAITGHRNSGILINPFRQGKYVLAHVTSNTIPGNYDKWWVLYEAQVDGSLLFKGAVRNQNLTGPPYSNRIVVYDVYSDDIIVLVIAFGFLGSTYAVLQALPSINDFLDGSYDGGAGIIQTTMLAPLGNTEDLSRNFVVSQTGNNNNGAGFRLPGNGRELFYIYFNRFYTQSCLASTSFTSPEVRNVIGPVYPFGSMIKIGLGDLDDFDDLQSMVLGPYRGRATDTYTIDNPNWVDQDSETLIPFLDEYTYLSDSTVGGTDCFSLQVSTQLRTNGRHWVVFVMVGLSDSLHRGVSGHGAFPVYAKVRLFDYNPTTEIATQIGEHTCVLRDAGDGPDNSVNALQHDLYPVAEVIETAESATIILHGLVYQSAFCQFFFAEE